MSGRIIPYTEFTRNETVKTQVCIIGTGCGGATLAALLAEQGTTVVMVEQGGHYDSSSFDENELNMAGKISAERNFATTTDGGVSLVYGNNVGGASVHYWADSYRTPEDRLKLWADSFGIEGHSAADLNPFFDRLDRTLNVHPARNEYFNRNNQLFQKGAKKLGWSGERVPQARKNCQKSGHCMQGCMFDAKQSQIVTHIPAAIARGTLIYSDMRARKFLFNSKNNAVEKLICASIDRASQKERGLSLTVEADVFVLAAGGFGSSAFLLRQGLRDRLPMLGEKLAINPSPMVHAIFDEEIIQWRNIPAVYGVDEWRLARFQNGSYLEGGYLLMPNQLHPGTLAALMPGFGREHRDTMKLLPRLGGTIAWIDDPEPELGRITMDGNRRHVDYPFGTQFKQMMRDCLKKQVMINFAAGAKEVIVADLKGTRLKSPAEMEKIDSIPIAPGSLMMAAPHPAGGCRMGPDPRTSVVGSDHRVHGFGNLFVSDPSVFPTAVSVDPSYTIMAFSHVAAASIMRTL